MLRYLPSWDDYLETFQSILQQPQQILFDSWKKYLEFDTCLKMNDLFRNQIQQEGFVFHLLNKKFLFFRQFRLINQCDKCGDDLYIGLQENSSNYCQCQKQNIQS